MSSVASGSEKLQYAALPWRRKGAAAPQILLVTTRRTRRWIVPKGWPVAGMPPHQCAAHEALEEAGIEGKVAPRPLGSFIYDKRLKSGDVVACTVIVFPMEVLRQHRSWPEKAERDTCWCTVEEALGRVTDPGLRRLITKFAKTLQSDRQRAAAA